MLTIQFGILPSQGLCLPHRIQWTPILGGIHQTSLSCHLAMRTPSWVLKKQQQTDILHEITDLKCYLVSLHFSQSTGQEVLVSLLVLKAILGSPTLVSTRKMETQSLLTIHDAFKLSQWQSQMSRFSSCVSRLKNRRNRVWRASILVQREVRWLFFIPKPRLTRLQSQSSLRDT